MRRLGRIVRWKPDKGYGFIATADGEPQVFVHLRALDRALLPPRTGTVVSFVVTTDKQGRPRAEGVGPVHRQVRRNSAFGAGFVAAAVLLALAVLCWARVLPWATLWLYLGASLVALAAYAADKSAAVAGEWRTPESTLHLLALLGGWPGALYAQQRLRHKTRKPSFRACFWATVVINLAALGYTCLDHRGWLAGLVSGIGP